MCVSNEFNVLAKIGTIIFFPIFCIIYAVLIIVGFFYGVIHSYLEAGARAEELKKIVKKKKKIYSDKYCYSNPDGFIRFERPCKKKNRKYTRDAEEIKPRSIWICDSDEST